jgi:hypothetical protein
MLGVIPNLFGSRGKISACDGRVYNEGSMLAERPDQVQNGGGPEMDDSRSVYYHWRTNEMYGVSQGEM